MRRNFFWQPESATAIIYWSSSLIVLFYSLILALENTRPYWKSNLVLVVFLLLFWIGLRRRLSLKETEIKIIYSRFWKRESIPYTAIQAIEIENRHLRITVNDHSSTFVMRKRDLAILQQLIAKQVPQLLNQKEPEN
jgi:predicted type IV restriction endonuclease